jgi:fructose-1,6-bisphosphatase
MASGMMLSDFVLAANVDPELTQFPLEVASCFEEIPIAVCSVKLREVTGYASSQNIQGEKEVCFDAESNEILMKQPKLSHTLGLFLSEEVGEVLETKHHTARTYAWACDPRDGNSLINSSRNVGTIWSIHRVQGGSSLLGRFSATREEPRSSWYGCLRF